MSLKYSLTHRVLSVTVEVGVCGADQSRPDVSRMTAAPATTVQRDTLGATDRAPVGVRPAVSLDQRSRSELQVTERFQSDSILLTFGIPSVTVGRGRKGTNSMAGVIIVSCFAEDSLRSGWCAYCELETERLISIGLCRSPTGGSSLRRCASHPVPSSGRPGARSRSC